MLDDKQLIDKCLKNSSIAFEELYNRFSANMFGVCLRYARNFHDAEDLLHEGFIRVMEKMKDYRAEGSLNGWMRRLMVTTAINYYRKKSASSFIVELNELFTKENDYENGVSYMSTQELLEHIQQMPDGYRVIFNMHVVEGYKHTEIAEMLNISESTSKSQLLKARRTLMAKLKEDEYEKVI